MKSPIYVEVNYKDPLVYLDQFQQRSVVFLDSSKNQNGLGQYSYIAVDPFEVISYDGSKILADDKIINKKDIFDFLSEKLNRFKLDKVRGLPPFQGGFAGVFSYDLGRAIEQLPSYAEDDLKLPLLTLGCYDLVLSFDHTKKKAYIISTGFPAEGVDAQSRAVERIDWALFKIKEVNTKTELARTPCCSEEGVVSNFDPIEYQASVQSVRDFILEGDVFEVNLSQRFNAPLNGMKPIELYRRLRSVNPAPFSSFVNLGEFSIASASPERFIKLNGRVCEARPIKGTAPRSADLAEDQRLADALLASMKNRSENTMIVDLMRNDLSRVCEPGSISVPQHCGLESFQTVHHLVSVVTGKLKPEFGPFDLIKATFPGGSITGAPKVRSMEIIDELEPHRRGPYCGSIGFIGFDGSMDLSIVIRTFVLKDDQAYFHAGGAVVLDSDPKGEYDETLVKASAMHRALVEEVA